MSPYDYAMTTKRHGLPPAVIPGIVPDGMFVRIVADRGTLGEQLIHSCAITTDDEAMAMAIQGYVISVRHLRDHIEATEIETIMYDGNCGEPIQATRVTRESLIADEAVRNAEDG